MNVLGIAMLAIVMIGKNNVSAGPLACLKKRGEITRRNLQKPVTPDYVQMRRCCGTIPYKADVKQCCKGEVTKRICEEWSNWMSWTACSASCGYGERHRFRTCKDGEGCDEHAKETESCKLVSCRSVCHVCHTSTSNEKCNEVGKICQTEEGEGCQSLVRRENNLYFVEKRCKQMKACFIQGRTLAIQKACDPSNSNSMCMYCCSGSYCNKNETTEMPSWYTDSWQEWLHKLDRYATFVKQTGDISGSVTTYEVPLLLRVLPETPEADSGRNRTEIVSLDGKIGGEYWKDQGWSTDIDTVFISAIIEATEISHQGGHDKSSTMARTMSYFIRALARHLPVRFRVDVHFTRKWANMT